MSENLRLPNRVHGNFEAVRGIAAFLVLLAHTVSAFWKSSLGANVVTHAFSWLAHYSVIAFFVLSGFLISMSIWRNFTRNEGFLAEEFLVSRYLRIYPPLIIGLLLTFLVEGLFHLSLLDIQTEGLVSPLRSEIDFDPGIYWNCLLLIAVFDGGYPDANGVYWSLPLEWWCYLVGFLLANLLLSRRQWKLNVCISILLFACMSSLDLFDSQLFCEFLLYWMLGALTFVIYLTKPKWVWSAKTLFVVGLLCAIPMVVFSSPLQSTVASDWKDILEKLGFVCGVVLLMPLLLSRFESTETWRRIGGFSYTLYITHFPILVVGFALFSSRLATMAVWQRVVISLLFIGVALALAFYLAKVGENRRVIEEAGRRIRNRVIGRSNHGIH